MQSWRERGYSEIPNTRTGQVLRVDTNLLDEIQLHGHARLSIEQAAATIRAPWLIVHGDADETVPVSEGEQLHAASDGVSELLVVPGGTHTFNVSHRYASESPQLTLAMDRTVEFFSRHLLAE